MIPKLTKKEHKQYLDKFMGIVDGLKEEGLERHIPKFTPMVQEALISARDASYITLAKEYYSKFEAKGLDLQRP